MASTVVVVGGSMAGLMHGLQLKRQGRNVVVLEQDPGSNRRHYQAGVGFRINVQEFLRRHDDTGVNVSVLTHGNHIAYRTIFPVLYSFVQNGQMTNWSLLYHILRANFDGSTSAVCPHPPPSRARDGRAEYRTGKRVEGLEYDQVRGLVTVRYVDVVDGRQESITTDLVIGADGVHSTIRRLVGAQARKRYSGYVSWRGAIPENSVSEETSQYFADRVAFNLLSGRSYILCYLIPTEDGHLEPGERLLNLVLYYNMAEGSTEMTDAFTDIHGKLHHNTVPQGLVRPAVWDRFREGIQPKMIRPFAELLSKTDSPFVTKVNDCLCTTPCFFDGHLLLVGDALTSMRPHVAQATEQAAYHSNSLEDVWGGKTTLEAWSREVGLEARRQWLLSIVIGNIGLASTFALLWSLAKYMVFIYRYRRSRI